MLGFSYYYKGYIIFIQKGITEALPIFLLSYNTINLNLPEDDLLASIFKPILDVFIFLYFFHFFNLKKKINSKSNLKIINLEK